MRISLLATSPHTIDIYASPLWPLRSFREASDRLSEAPDRLLEAPDKFSETPDRLSETPDRHSEVPDRLSESQDRLPQPRLLRGFKQAL